MNTETETQTQEQTKVVVHEYYQAKDMGGYFTIPNGKYQFDSYEEILHEVNLFKEDPRIHNENMTDENVAYWSKRTYTIQKIVTTTIDITSIA